jgi:hypothetical protein
MLLKNIKQILLTRPHIKRKSESKVERLEKIKSGNK